MGDFNFNFEFVSSGGPIITLNAFGIAFNPVCRAMLGYPDKINIGFDERNLAIGIKAHDSATQVKSYDFEGRQRNGWVRVGAKEYIRYLSSTTKIDFMTKAKQFIPIFDESKKMLIVVVAEENIKK